MYRATAVPFRRYPHPPGNGSIRSILKDRAPLSTRNGSFSVGASFMPHVFDNDADKHFFHHRTRMRPHTNNLSYSNVPDNVFFKKFDHINVLTQMIFIRRHFHDIQDPYKTRHPVPSCLNSRMSPGWQSSARHRASSVENLNALTLPFFILDRFMFVMPTLSANSNNDILRSTMSLSSLMTRAMTSHTPYGMRCGSRNSQNIHPERGGRHAYRHPVYPRSDRIIRADHTPAYIH